MAYVIHALAGPDRPLQDDDSSSRLALVGKLRR